MASQLLRGARAVVKIGGKVIGTFSSVDWTVNAKISHVEYEKERAEFMNQCYDTVHKYDPQNDGVASRQLYFLGRHIIFEISGVEQDYRCALYVPTGSVGQWAGTQWLVPAPMRNAGMPWTQFSQTEKSKMIFGLDEYHKDYKSDVSRLVPPWMERAMGRIMFETSTDFDTGVESTTSDRWKKEGRCQKCGELGPFVHGAMTCSTHGPY